MVQDRVRRAWGRRRERGFWLFHPSVLFGVLFFGVWLKSEAVFFMACGYGLMWDGYQLRPWVGDLRMLDLDALRFGLVALYFLVAASGAVLESRLPGSAKARLRAVGLAGLFLVVSIGTVAMVTRRPGTGPGEFAAWAEKGFGDTGATSPQLAFSVREDFPGARDCCRRWLSVADESRRAWAAAALYAVGQRDVEVRRALASGFDGVLEDLSRDWEEGLPGISERRVECGRKYHLVALARGLVEGDADYSNPWLFLFRGLDSHRLDSLTTWWRENRDRCAAGL